MGALLTALAVPAVGQNAPQDYPQWRGRYGDGSAAAFIAPDKWPDTLTRVWQVEVGEGYATPLVVGDMVYVFTRREGNEVIAALDAATGVERWRSSYPVAYTPSSPTKAHGSGPKATPLFHEGKLFTVGITGILSAFDAGSGKRLWQTDAPAEVPFYSAAASPVGVPGLVIAVGYRGSPDGLPDALRRRELGPRTRRPVDELVYEGRWGEPSPLFVESDT